MDWRVRIFYYYSPGPEVLHTPCVPSNMSMPGNGCIVYDLESVLTPRITVADGE